MTPAAVVSQDRSANLEVFPSTQDADNPNAGDRLHFVGPVEANAAATAAVGAHARDLAQPPKRFLHRGALGVLLFERAHRRFNVVDRSLRSSSRWSTGGSE
jgi:hypothetical protein